LDLRAKVYSIGKVLYRSYFLQKRKDKQNLFVSGQEESNKMIRLEARIDIILIGNFYLRHFYFY